jgi:RNA recognition motif-containing protein
MNIYIGNMAYSLTEKGLEELFSEFGVAENARIITDRDTSRSKGFGFIEMPNQAEAVEAIKQLDGKDVDGRNLKVNEAKPREDRPSRGPRY